MCAGCPAFRRELGCYRCQVGRAVGKSNRPSRSEATGNEKVLLDFPSRDLLFTFKKPLRGAVGRVMVSLEGQE